MDHAIDSLVDGVREEWNSGKYKKMSECPSYPAAKAIVDAIHVMEKYYYGKNQTMSVKEQVIW